MTDLSRMHGDRRSLAEVFWVSLKLGLVSFGGPIAHLGTFHNEYVILKKWLDEKSYTDLVGLCQFLPGPASSQLGIAIGTIRAGVWGGIVAWFGFTAPSAVALVVFALLLRRFDFADTSWIHGLKIVAVAVVAQAIFLLWKKLIRSVSQIGIAIGVAIALSFWNSSFAQITLIFAAGVFGYFLFKSRSDAEVFSFPIGISRRFAIICLCLFFGLLALLPAMRLFSSDTRLWMADSFFRSGALVFGGGHVVLPLLEKELVPVGLISEQDFLVGYGAAQAVPGPLFTFASYLGAVIDGIPGAILATFFIFLPAYVSIIGILPFWNSVRSERRIQGILTGANCAVVGILIAAFYRPLWTDSIRSFGDFCLASVLVALLVFFKLPSWIAVIVGSLGSVLIRHLPL